MRASLHNSTCLLPRYIFYKYQSVYLVLTEITFPRADRDLLILAPSFKRSPVAPVLPARSEPVIGFCV